MAGEVRCCQLPWHLFLNPQRKQSTGCLIGCVWPDSLHLIPLCLPPACPIGCAGCGRPGPAIGACRLGLLLHGPSTLLWRKVGAFACWLAQCGWIRFSLYHITHSHGAPTETMSVIPTAPTCEQNTHTVQGRKHENTQCTHSLIDGCFVGYGHKPVDCRCHSSSWEHRS